MKTLLFIPALLNGNVEAFFVKLAVVVILWFIVIAASCVDLITGIQASRRTHKMKTTSWGLRRTISKDLQYIAVLVVMLGIDIALSILGEYIAIFNVPILSVLGVVVTTAIELLSVNENIHKGRAAEDDTTDVVEIVTGIVDKIGEDKVVAALKAIEDRYEKKKE